MIPNKNDTLTYDIQIQLKLCIDKTHIHTHTYITNTLKATCNKYRKVTSLITFQANGLQCPSIIPEWPKLKPDSSFVYSENYYSLPVPVHKYEYYTSNLNCPIKKLSLHVNVCFFTAFHSIPRVVRVP